MQNKILVICGPTATGKTKLGIRLAKKFGGEIVSADSRQVYKGLDIGTGKEWSEEVNIWGYDLVSAREEFSVSNFYKYALSKIEDLLERGKLPIIVGGTGFYIKAVTDGIFTLEIPRNENLRKILEKREVGDLYESLAEMDSAKAASMNTSDKKNPRRLIRAIEVAQFMLDHGKYEYLKPEISGKNILFIGLTAEKEKLFENIDLRVDKRVNDGIKSEIKKLLSSGLEWSDQSMLSLGYRQWRDFFEGEVDEAVVINEWKKEEKKYAKRQLTWFGKDKRINWFDISDRNCFSKVEKVVEKWHNASDA